MEMKVLEEQVGPLLPSDLTKVAENRDSKRAGSAAEMVLPAGEEGVKENRMGYSTVFRMLRRFHRLYRRTISVETLQVFGQDRPEGSVFSNFN